MFVCDVLVYLIVGLRLLLQLHKTSLNPKTLGSYLSKNCITTDRNKQFLLVKLTNISPAFCSVMLVNKISRKNWRYCNEHTN